MSYDFARYLNIRSAINPVLSPDGQRVAFLSDITGIFQAWSVGIQGEGVARWPRQLTFFSDKIWEIHGTPAADHLLAVGDVAGNERQQFYLITNYGAGEGGREGHHVIRLTQDDQAIHTFGAWSQDGRRLVYTSNARNQVDFDLYLLDLESGTARCLREWAGRRSVVAWGRGDRAILSVDTVATEQIELYLLDLESGQERHLAAGQPHARYSEIRWVQDQVYLLSDRLHDRGALCRLDLASGELEPLLFAEELDAAAAPHRGELELLAVAPQGDQAALTYNGDGYSHLFLVDLVNRRWRRVESLPLGVIGHLQFSRDGRRLILDLQSPVQPPDIWLLELETVEARQLTFSNLAGLDPATFVAPELIRYPTFDGRSIPAFFYRPRQSPPSQGYPCILYVHGGPAGQQRPDFDVRFQYFLHRGYALLVPNVRGSTGYGRHYMMLDDVERRLDSVADLKHAVAWLHQQPLIDSRRIAIYGRSYGGYMVLAALTEYPELFAAGIDVVGIANWVTFLERTSPWRRAHREREYGSLAEHRAFLERISPIHKADRIRAPLLVLAGDNDPRVPLFESEQIVARVREAGGTVEFVHYPDEGHKFSKLANRIDSFTRMADFLDWHLGGEAG
ncbi:S9 family peptidase [Litorilinea aerophila]|uniref:Acyl-peptide hydrolase n=1 Tax=Litorilinea aerophila TaxID=1204385 RepID=A0A540VDB0_9CHLR|nr:S9 family peptidase [Litorilinea aerophila]MCC9078119.1 S9 family peptidase [Litorilinea aerophila]